MDEKKLRAWDLFYANAFAALLVKHEAGNGRGAAATEEMAHKAANLADMMINVRDRARNIKTADMADEGD